MLVSLPSCSSVRTVPVWMVPWRSSAQDVLRAARLGEDIGAAEGVFKTTVGLFEEFGAGRRVDSDWPLIPYAESMLKYGTDKPDLRNPIEMQVVSDHFRGSGFGIFAKLLEQEGTEIRAIPAPGGGSRKFADRMNSFAQQHREGHALHSATLTGGKGHGIVQSPIEWW